MVFIHLLIRIAYSYVVFKVHDTKQKEFRDWNERCFTIECVSEQGKHYNMKVTESIKKDTKIFIFLDEVTQIGAKISVCWSGTEVKETG